MEVKLWQKILYTKDIPSRERIISSITAALQILETKKVGDLDVATKVSVQLQLTDPNVRSRDRIVKKTEKDSLYAAIDVAAIWLERSLAGR